MYFVTQRWIWCVLLCIVAAPSYGAVPKRVTVLHGDLTFEVPAEVSFAKSPSAPSKKYAEVAYLVSPDRRFSVSVTYGKHTLAPTDLPTFLEQKFTSYSTLRSKLPHFRWLEHALVQRDGRQWAEVSFTHGMLSTKERQVYTRCLSTVARRHLLEIWVVTHRAPDPREKSLVDQAINSVRLVRDA